jgi:RNase H-like domain found in reverse transcriptase
VVRRRKRVVTDASLQEAEDKEGWEPISYASRKLRGAEIRYITSERKCGVVVFSQVKWRHHPHAGNKLRW